VATTPVDTTKVIGRRNLHFNSIDEILADAERLGQAKSIRALGNWSPGQLFRHLALSMNGAIDGFDTRVPWLFRLLGRYVFKARLLKKGMPPGYKLSAEMQTVLYPNSAVSTEEGLQALRDVVKRWRTESKRAATSPFLGPMSDDDWTQLQCRHAELHFSFLIPENG
jgi:hypothetical protein